METLPRKSGEDTSFTQIIGSQCAVRGCHGSDASLKEALESVPDAKSSRIAAAKIMSSLKLLSEGVQLRSPDRMRSEGDLPGNAGNFYAVRYVGRSINLRAYIFLCDGDWWVSHFLNKKADKLSKLDIERVEQNYRSICGNN